MIDLQPFDPKVRFKVLNPNHCSIRVATVDVFTALRRSTPKVLASVLLDIRVFRVNAELETSFPRLSNLFSLKAIQLNIDKLYEITFCMKSLHRKTLYNNAVKIFSIKAMIFEFYAVIIVSIFQGVEGICLTLN